MLSPAIIIRGASPLVWPHSHTLNSHFDQSPINQCVCVISRKPANFEYIIQLHFPSCKSLTPNYKRYSLIFNLPLESSCNNNVRVIAARWINYVSDWNYVFDSMAIYNKLRVWYKQRFILRWHIFIQPLCKIGVRQTPLNTEGPICIFFSFLSLDLKLANEMEK